MFKWVKETHVYFIGIGGIGMSGLAEVLLAIGLKVSGSDIKESSTLEKLRSKGATIFVGHRGEQVEDATVVVYTSAVDEKNPEIMRAKELKLPLIQRAEMLSELMRLKYGIAIAGSHGKTTTTSFVATILRGVGQDPTHIIGGVVKYIYLGSSRLDILDMAVYFW
jgi:UDP-N-acetylmuramate--alanine ligase